MTYNYEKSFFSTEQIDAMFDSTMDSMQQIHQEAAPYNAIAEHLKSKLGMHDPLCVQTFVIGRDYDPQHAHIDIATAIFPSIINVWFCGDDCPGESFGVLLRKNHPDLYEKFYTQLDRGAISDFKDLCSEDLFDKYTPIIDYKKGDVLFFDSRQVHRKLTSSRRRTLIFKYIDQRDLEAHHSFDYANIPGGPDWVRVLIFDRLRFFKTVEERKDYLVNTERLLHTSRGKGPGPAPQTKGSSLPGALKNLPRLFSKTG